MQSGKDGRRDPMSDDDDDIGEEFKDIDLGVTDKDITDAAEELIDAMWAKEQELAVIGDVLNTGEDDYYKSTPGWPKTEKYLEEAQEVIRSRYKELLTPTPSAFDPLIESTRAVAIALGSFDTSDYEPGDDLDSDDLVHIGGDDAFDVTTVGINYLTYWQGDLKYSLVENYLQPFPTIQATQGSLAKTLQKTARLLKLIFQNRRSAAAKGAKQATVAVEAINSGSDGAVAFTILGILSTGLSLVPGPAAAVTSAAGSTLSALGGKLAAKEKEIPLSASDVQGVVDNLFKALDESDETMRNDEAEVLKLLQSLEMIVSPLAAYSDDSKGNELIPMTPYVSYDKDIADVLEPHD